MIRITRKQTYCTLFQFATKEKAVSEYFLKTAYKLYEMYGSETLQFVIWE